MNSQSPIIISASRSTDIPAFYTEWFINRIKSGYCIWYNPFNRQPIKVCFDKTKVIVFWTKNPKPLLPYLVELDKRNIHYYFQFTLNNYEQENFEPNVPPIKDRIKTFKELSNQIGKEKVIWRFDPIIMTDTISPREILKRIWNIGNELKGYTEKLVFSFVDVTAYRKVQNNLIKETNCFRKETVLNAEPNKEQQIEVVEGLVKLRESWKKDGWNIKLATCAESIDLENYGIEHNRCIDGELMKKIFSDDEDLVYYINYGQERNNQQSLFGEEQTLKLKTPQQIKDKGQRKTCGCMISKDIGMYNTCKHFCVYCYANTSRISVNNRTINIDVNSESLVNVE